MDNINKQPKLLYVIYAFIMLISLNPYFIWHIDFRIMWIFYLAVSVILIAIYVKRLTNNSTALLICFLIAFFSAKRGNIMAIITPTFAVMPFLVFLYLNQDDQRGVLMKFKELLCVVLAVSLVAWVLFLAHISLPYFPDFYGDPDVESSYYVVKNYFAFILGVNEYNEDAYRFQSIFLEPGYIGCICAFMLFLDGFNYKSWQNKVLYATLAFSLSLAAWIIFAVSLVCYLIIKKKGQYVLFAAVLFGSIYYGAITYNGGDNVVKELILDRLEYKEDNQNISGYNRTSQYFDQLFDDFIISSKAITGDYDKFTKLIASGEHLVGWKAYSMKYGIWGLLTYIFFYFIIYTKYKNGFKNLSWLLLFLLFFARGDTLAFNIAILIMYCAGVQSLGKSIRQELIPCK